jgi:DUF438 domain-containing protein
MWSFHDQIREEIKFVRKKVDAKDSSNISTDAMNLFNSLDHLLQVEEGRLLPRALELLNEDDWKEMYEGDKEIGWMLGTPPVQYPEPSKEDYIHPGEDKKRRKLPFSIEDRTHFDEGYLTPEHVNFIFKFLPVDITYVDENDTVQFFSTPQKRIFPRTTAIIGRKVSNCHPPESVHVVEKIVESFKNGEKDHADFWIKMKDEYILIRYFAVRDEQNNYKGVIEVTQEISDIKAIDGEKRLLDW